MSRPEDLFNQIIENGVDAIDNFIDQRTSEELFLDFKRSADNGTNTKLNQNDRNNFAKAISGFGNSEGGIIVWGVDCSRLDDGADVANAKFPITNVSRFKSWLDGAISGCTIPPHPNVKNEFINIDEEGNGFVITLIPKSNYSPHQVVGRLQYYIRAGSDFVPTPHGVLAGMFGKRPQPNIIYQYASEPISIGNDLIQFPIGLMLVNTGLGISNDLFLNLTIFGKPGPNCNIKFVPDESTNWRHEFIFGMQLSSVSQNNYKLPPEARCQPLVLEFYLKPPFNKSLKFKGLVGCEGSSSHSFSINVDHAKIDELYNEIIKKKDENNLLENDLYLFSRLITDQTNT